MQPGRFDVCRAVCVADAAVEVGESLLAADNQRYNGEVAASLCSMLSGTAAAVQSDVVHTASTTDAAAARHSGLHQHLTVNPQMRPIHQTIEPSVTAERLPNHDADTNQESSPLIVIVPDESASPGYQLSCDGHSSCEENLEVPGPLDNLAQLQSEASLCATAVVGNVVPSIMLVIYEPNVFSVCD